VFRHTTKKPGCFPEVLEHLRRHAGVTSPNQVAVVGDRLFTDVLMAGLMGSYVVWVRHGVEKPSGRLVGFFFSMVERWIVKGF
jgi:phosphatidylglycerophosphatase GEP4